MLATIPDLGPSAEPWERLEKETRKSFEAFCIYRDLGHSRSISKVRVKYQEAGGRKNEALLYRWSRVWKWVARVEMWERDLQRRTIIRLQHESIESVDRHLGEARLMQTRGLQILARMVNSEGMLLGQYKVSDGRTLLKDGINLERQIFGQTTGDDRGGEPEPDEGLTEGDERDEANIIVGFIRGLPEEQQVGIIDAVFEHVDKEDEGDPDTDDR